jgi:glutamate/tyrosine decarboxylase-like PLP-dependent enzyme
MPFDELVRTIAAVQSNIAAGPVVPHVAPAEIREYLTTRYDFTKPVDLGELCADVEQMLRKWQVHVTHPRYFGLFNPSVTIAGVVADTLVAMYNPQLAAWRSAPAPNEIERHTLGWLAKKLGLPDGTISTFTSGGAEANLSAVIVALTRTFPSYGEWGLRGLPSAPTLYVSREAHHSFNKIAHMTGLGRHAIRRVATTHDLKMDIGDLARQVAEDRQKGFAPFLVVGTGGTTGAGAIDPLPELAAFCQAESLWFHVDAAWGGAAVLSQRLKPHLAGIEGADSVTCDAHKWFSVPMAAGMFFCRHAETVQEAFRAETSYMPRKTAGPVFDPYTSSTQWSRRFIGLKLFLSLAERGESGYVEMIEHQARMGDVLRLVNSSPFPVVCFTRDGLVPARFLEALFARQIAWMSQVQLGDDPPVLRACVTSFKTTEADIASVVDEMTKLCLD